MTHPRGAELRRLVDADDVDGVLALATIDDIAEVWCRHAAVVIDECGDDEAALDAFADDAVVHTDWWAFDLLASRAYLGDQDRHRSTILALLAHARDDEVVGSIAAGPLEAFVSDDEDDLAWLEAEAAGNDRLRLALSGVWARVSDATFDRLDAIAAEPLSRPRPDHELPQPIQEQRAATARLESVAGPEWWRVLDDPSPEQAAAIEAFIVATRNAMSSRRNRGD